MASNVALRQGAGSVSEISPSTAISATDLPAPTPPSSATEQSPVTPFVRRRNQFLSWLGVVALIYLLVSAVSLISSGFKVATGSQAEELFQFATNPFVGLMVGIFATALIQSSSTVTSIIVGLVAGGLPVSIAVPMVMGANIGTTVTNFLISLGYMREKEEFKRAFAAASVHDFYNLLAVAIFLPLEIMTGFLEKSAYALAQPLAGGGDYKVSEANFVKKATSPVTGLVDHVTGAAPSDVFKGLAMLMVGMVMIFVAIRYIGKLLKRLMVGRARRILHTAIGRGPVSGVASGATVTVLVQSSTTATSLMIPLAGSGVLSLRQIYPFTVGANIGTTATALLAATAVGGPLGVFALEIAFVHLLFNLFALLIIFCMPFLRDLPLRGAEWLSDLAARRKAFAVAWVGIVFLGIPAALIFGSTIF